MSGSRISAVGTFTGTTTINWSYGGYVVNPGEEREISLPGERKLKVAADGSVELIDSDKTTRLPSNIRNFNEFLNASDVMEQFSGEIAKLKDGMAVNTADLPLNLYIRWLVLNAAEKDGDTPPPGFERKSFEERVTGKVGVSVIPAVKLW